MIWYIPFPNIHNEIARISNRSIKSFLIISFVIKEVEAGIRTIISLVFPNAFQIPTIERT